MFMARRLICGVQGFCEAGAVALEMYKQNHDEQAANKLHGGHQNIISHWIYEAMCLGGDEFLDD